LPTPRNVLDEVRAFGDDPWLLGGDGLLAVTAITPPADPTCQGVTVTAFQQPQDNQTENVEVAAAVATITGLLLAAATTAGAAASVQAGIGTVLRSRLGVPTTQAARLAEMATSRLVAPATPIGRVSRRVARDEYRDRARYLVNAGGGW
jgi:hypothetical protein